MSIKSPTAGTIESGIVAVLVNASDNVGAKKAELYVDGKLNATSTAALFKAKWNAKMASRGQHTIQSKAYDAAGNRFTSASVMVSK